MIHYPVAHHPSPRTEAAPHIRPGHATSCQEQCDCKADYPKGFHRTYLLSLCNVGHSASSALSSSAGCHPLGGAPATRARRVSSVPAATSTRTLMVWAAEISPAYWSWSPRKFSTMNRMV